MLKIKEIRELKKMSAQDLATEFKVSRQTIYDWEGAKTAPSPEKMIQLSEFLGCTIGQLFGKEEINTTIFIKGISESKETSETRSDNPEVFYNAMINANKVAIEAKEEVIKIQKEEIAFLKENMETFRFLLEQIKGQYSEVKEELAK